MADFLVELYVARSNRRAVSRWPDRARVAADALSRSGTPVRFAGLIFVPDDETCFLLYEADSAGAVEEAARRAGLSFERVAKAVASAVKD